MELAQWFATTLWSQVQSLHLQALNKNLLNDDYLGEGNLNISELK